MIKSLTLINFQIHKKLTIEFDKNFNTVMGANDKGKSSVIRAIHWVFYNQPSGDWMRRIDEDGKQLETEVVIKFEDDTIIKRIKGEKTNKYIVNGESYSNFGHGVPEAIQEVLKIRKFKTSKEEFPIHVSVQDDLPFLIHTSSVLRGGVIDVLTGMSIVQKAISDFKKEKTDYSKELKMYKEQQTQCLDLLDKLEPVEDLEEELKVIDNLNEEENKLEEKRLRLKEIFIGLTGVLIRIKTYSVINDCILPDELIEKYNSVDKKLNDLIALRKCIEENEVNIKKAKLATDLDISDLGLLVNKHESIESDLKIKKELKIKIENILIEIKNCLKNIKQMQVDVEILEEKLKICPTCGRAY